MSKTHNMLALTHTVSALQQENERLRDENEMLRTALTGFCACHIQVGDTWAISYHGFAEVKKEAETLLSFFRTPGFNPTKGAWDQDKDGIDKLLRDEDDDGSMSGNSDDGR